MVSNSNLEHSKSKESATGYDIKMDSITSGIESLSNHLFKWIDETANDIYAIWDETGHLVYISNSIKRLLGYDKNEIKGISWDELLDDDGVMLLKRKYNKNKLDKKMFNLNIRHKNERYIWCECVVEKKVDEKNKQIYFFSTIKDITDKKEVEEMMVRSEKMSIAGQLAAGVAHEIRNPLTAIKGFLQLLQAGINRKDEYYKIMIDEIEKMEAITSEMLFISKPLTDYEDEESVIGMIEDVITLLRSQAKMKDIKIIQKNSIDSFIYCDKSQVKQVLINLVKNAIEAMDEPGNIIITNETNDSFVEINIIDEGEGISEEIIHKLGEPFFTTKQHGTGLGLMITKQILRRHNATMEILQNKNKGSTFKLRFFNN